ncbi:InlB B-repeat-containing protein [Changpingibacter yushuensis]|uniref:InlB B-repeat-containing protein n=1 Tax=Changpingibacter yushuensis TaxID=2758440 RepID=UPI0015F64CCF|nr:hypothetical protein [Changpingibacter yushuensis]
MSAKKQRIDNKHRLIALAVATALTVVSFPSLAFADEPAVTDTSTSDVVAPAAVPEPAAEPATEPAVEPVVEPAASEPAVQEPAVTTPPQEAATQPETQAGKAPAPTPTKTTPTHKTVTPGKPSVDYVKCLPYGKTVLDLVTVPSTANIVYTKSVSGAGPSATVIVKATAAEGFRLVLVQGSGWEPDKVLKNTATYKITFRHLKDCPKIAIPVPPQVTNPECLADGSVSKGSVVPAANTESITYKVDEQRGGKPGDEQVFVVTAKAINGFKFSKETIGEGWTLGGKNDIATYIVKFTDPRPCVVIPTDPTVTHPVCKADGSVSEGIVQLPADTNAIRYEKRVERDGKDGKGSTTIIVVATAQKHVKFSAESLGEGWVLKSDKVATYTVKFTDPRPCAVTPTDPTVTDPVCKADGSVTKGQVTLPADTRQISYGLSGKHEKAGWDGQAGKYGDDSAYANSHKGNTVIVTATAHKGFKFTAESLGEGWVLKSDKVATYTVKFTDPRPCAVTPTKPTVTDPVCKKDGSVTMGTVTLPADTKAIHYEKKTDKHGNIIIIATAQKGYTFSSASVGEGWQLSKYSHKVSKSDKGDWGSGDRTYGDGNGYDRGHHGNWTNSKGVKVATYTVKFADPTPCAVPPKSTPKAPVVVVKPSVTPVYTPVHALANTGADSSSLFIGAIALIVAGVASVALASRRRNEE